jgi:tetratricopeptide (TPR) repeat protein
MRRATAALIVLLVAGSLAVPARSAPQADRPCVAASVYGSPAPVAKKLPLELRADNLFGAYVAAGAAPQSIASVLTTYERFEQFRKDFRDRVLLQWRNEPVLPARAVFMLDVAQVGLSRNFRYWLDFIDQGRRYVTDRAELVGQNVSIDLFEVAWHKASLSILSGIRRPDYVEDCAIAPLAHRMSPRVTTSELPPLVDPWIEIARGYADEGFTIVNAALLGTRGVDALSHYDEAARYDATRAEAVTRKAWLLIRLNREQEALGALESFDDSWTTELAVKYWSRLFRGQALMKLRRFDDAERAFRASLDLVPSAQTARLGALTADTARDRLDAAYNWAREIRTAPESYADPFWLYPFGDGRFKQARLDALRKSVRP